MVSNWHVAYEQTVKHAAGLSGALHSSLFHRFVCVGHGQETDVSKQPYVDVTDLTESNVIYIRLLVLTRMVKVQHKLSKAVECLEYFTTHQWSFKDDNVRDLLTHMSQQDRESFQFDVSEIHWEKYMEKYVLGFREFLFKQSPKSLPSCRRKMSRLV